MRETLVKFASAFAVVSAAACAHTPSQIPSSSALSVKLQATLDRSVETGETAFAVGLVSQNGELLFEGAAGEAAPGYPACAGTIFRLDSITKPITAVAILILAEKGRLHLDDPAAKFIPAFAEVKVERKTSDGASIFSAPARPITVRDLLTHTAGLAGYSPETDALFSSKTNIEFAEGIAKLPLRHDPGEGFQYGNAYEVLPAIVARASGVGFDVFVRDNILTPLKMDDTYFVVPQEKRERFAALYTKSDAGDIEVFASPDDPETEDFPSGGGGLKSTVRDYRRFAEMLLNGGERDGVRILSAQSIKKMTSPQVAKEIAGSWQGDYGWGLGLAVRRGLETNPQDKKPVGAFGWNGGYGTLFFVDPVNRRVGVVATQMQYGNEFDVRERFEEAVYSSFPQPAPVDTPRN